MQAHVCNVLSHYMSATLKSFEAALNAHQSLGDVKEVAAQAEANLLAGGLLQGVRSAFTKLKEMHEKLQVRMDVHMAAVKTCVNSIDKADRDAAELRWYIQKVDALAGGGVGADSESELEVSPLRAQKRLERNQEKLDRVRHSAAIAEIQAKERVNRCISRINLDEMTCQVVAATASAFQEAVKYWSHSSEAYNPFEEDLQEIDEAETARLEETVLKHMEPLPEIGSPEASGLKQVEHLSEIASPESPTTPGEQRFPESPTVKRVALIQQMRKGDTVSTEAGQHMPSDSSSDDPGIRGLSQPVIEEGKEVTLTCWPCISGMGMRHRT